MVFPVPSEGVYLTLLKSDFNTFLNFSNSFCLLHGQISSLQGEMQYIAL